MSTSVYDPPVRDPAPASTTVDTTTSWIGGAHTHLRVSWAAIFGGVILVVAVQLLLMLLGAGVGLGTVHANAGSTPDASSLGIGAGVWWIVSSVVALLVGGYVSAWLAGSEIRFDGLLQGVITWGIATLLTFWLLGSAVGGIIGGGFSALDSVAGAAGSGLADAAKPLEKAAGISPDMIQQQEQAFLHPAAPADPATMSAADADKEVGTDLAAYAGGGADAPAAKERVIDIMAAQAKISRADAAQKFDQAQAKMQQARDQAIAKAKTAADTAAAAASKTSFAAFGVLLLDLLAAALGGSLAVQHRSQTSRTVNGKAVGAV